MRVSLVAAIADHGVIGRDGGLPWHLPADLARFKALTWGHHLIMGRRTFESIGRALPGRTTVVVSRGHPELPADVLLAPGLPEALELAASRGEEEAFVVGGAEIFREALPRAHRLHLTRVHGTVEGDIRFPPVDWKEWALVSLEEHPADERHAWPLSFRLYQRLEG
jgi:dihydrofolate reductase